MTSIQAKSNFLGLIPLFTLLLTSWAMCSPIEAMSEDLPKNPGKSGVPQFCKSTNEISAFFKEKGVPVEVKEIQGKNENFCFVLAYPYSGVDTTDLYCYVKAGEGWGLFLTAALWKSGPNSIEIKPEGDFMDVTCRGVVVLKVNPPK
ncbi:MAG TPA: hypothetical protein VN048_11220 [Verrucomicrobiae bacterium]|jgi:hypothetical protein|nr:hypothetical protein [Verrucomicrobiae bacterium]